MYKSINYPLKNIEQISQKKFERTKVIFLPFCELQLVSFVFHSRFLYELKHKICFSKTICEIFYFRFRFVFIIKVYIFVQQRAWLLDFYVIIVFKNRIIQKRHTLLLADLWF